ncbi:MAG: hypothetical protein DRR16_11650 [Candidatus Parabeggiatoa sp. nov. 3]|nr:MAG: hypothetical protein DRR00_00660 [Gammaproteobacteria bacterium]RKZ69739.1 MAG: hypothetical protein DRQ99_00080 [Gammaproteobacteria bacterium]RKZ85592.1 MAG: hypothetical protein DRR16_11650 [Gammaproteobacteria bacterium]
MQKIGPVLNSKKNRYERMSPDAKNRLVSGSLGLALTRWHGVYEGIEAVWLRWETLIKRGIIAHSTRSTRYRSTTG